MKRTDVTTTTIDLDERDKECITAIQKHILSVESPIYTVSRRVAISWALRKVAGELQVKHEEEKGSAA